ncbi:hypothetical protein [Acetobacter thailandicus]|uniref:hypothetical protein n=1 Tax=Acetobacter thailandicus TaxID=1502842 RepID=UPI001BA49DDC|nr:hypothetical protein [Acetobacter thailandicus]MBS0959875.1 hypothetical protein [Acetobacter thailandicus]
MADNNIPPDHYLIIEDMLQGLIIVDTHWAMASNLIRLIRDPVLYDEAINRFLTYLRPDQKRQLEQFVARYGVYTSVVRNQPFTAAMLRNHGLTAFCFVPWHESAHQSAFKNGSSAQQVASPQMQKIAAMSTTERVAELLYRAFFKAGGVLAEGMTPQNLLKILMVSAGTLVALQYAPVGWGLDAALLALGLTMILYGGLAAVRELIDSVSLATHATTDAQMDHAVSLCADAMATLGVDSVMGFLIHKVLPNSGGRAAASETATQDASSASARQPSDGIVKPSPEPWEEPYTRQDSSIRYDNFKTKEVYDPLNRSLLEKKADAALFDQGWDKTMREQVIDSGSEQKIIPYQEGSKVYGFSSKNYMINGETVIKGSNPERPSAYWFHEDDLSSVKEQYWDTDAQRWDSVNIKKDFALPCFNAADDLHAATVNRNLDNVVRARIDPATENYSMSLPDSTIKAGSISLPGGRSQITLPADSLGNFEILR